MTHFGPFWTPFLTPSDGFWAKGYEIPMESKGILTVLARPPKTAQKGGPRMGVPGWGSRDPLFGGPRSGIPMEPASNIVGTCPKGVPKVVIPAGGGVMRAPDPWDGGPTTNIAVGGVGTPTPWDGGPTTNIAVGWVGTHRWDPRPRRCVKAI